MALYDLDGTDCLTMGSERYFESKKHLTCFLNLDPVYPSKWVLEEARRERHIAFLQRERAQNLAASSSRQTRSQSVSDSPPVKTKPRFVVGDWIRKTFVRKAQGNLDVIEQKEDYKSVSLVDVALQCDLNEESEVMDPSAVPQASLPPCNATKKEKVKKPSVFSCQYTQMLKRRIAKSMGIMKKEDFCPPSSTSGEKIPIPQYEGIEIEDGITCTSNTRGSSSKYGGHFILPPINEEELEASGDWEVDGFEEETSIDETMATTSTAVLVRGGPSGDYLESRSSKRGARSILPTMSEAEEPVEVQNVLGWENIGDDEKTCGLSVSDGFIAPANSPILPRGGPSGDY